MRQEGGQQAASSFSSSLSEALSGSDPEGARGGSSSSSAPRAAASSGGVRSLYGTPGHGSVHIDVRSVSSSGTVDYDDPFEADAVIGERSRREVRGLSVPPAGLKGTGERTGREVGGLSLPPAGPLSGTYGLLYQYVFLDSLYRRSPRAPTGRRGRWR